KFGQYCLNLLFMTKTILWIFLFFSFLSTYGEDFSFGSVTSDEMTMPYYTNDSTANAVVLREYGRARFMLDDQRGEINLVFTHHVRIKIFNMEGAEKANIVIPLYKDGDREEFLEDLKAATIHVNAGNQREETWLENKNSYKEEYSKYVTLTKFTLPNIKPGSIIEYSYRIVSPRLFNFRTWEFQTDIPKIYSEYEAIIPGTYNY